MSIVQVVNMKTCCGDVRLGGPRRLTPGDATALEVTLRLGEAVGPLSHWATVETDHPSAPRLDYWTLADVRPRARVEEAPGVAAPIFPATSARRSFLAVVDGTATDPPPSLADRVLRSGLDASRDGPAIDTALKGGLVERARPFSVRLTGGRPGRRIDVIEVDAGGETLIRRPINWEVASAIDATPSAILSSASGGRRDIKVLPRARDGRPFRVLGTSSSLPEVGQGPRPSAAAAIQTLHLAMEPDPRGPGRAGELTITTDRADHPTVSIPIYVAGASAAGVTP